MFNYSSKVKKYGHKYYITKNNYVNVQKSVEKLKKSGIIDNDIDIWQVIQWSKSLSQQ